jgi:putative DNA primase/helicase
MSTDTGPGAAPSADDLQHYRLTFGIYNQTAPWTDVRSLSWLELDTILTNHEVGIKEGTCIVPAVFSGQRRAKAEAVRIDVAFLDCDTGVTLEEIKHSTQKLGCAAIVSSTYSHGTTQTVAKRSHWDRFRAQHEGQDELAEKFLLVEKQYLPRVAAGARVVAETVDQITFEHVPCPKFRVAIPLLRPWVAADYPNQARANDVWADRIAALAAALGLQHDQACIDTSRLFYLPRRPETGAPAETAVVEGSPCDIFALGPQGSSRGRHRRRDEIPPYTDPETGEVIDLVAWACQYGRNFEITDALRARRPDVLLGKVSSTAKQLIRCVNEHEHTHAGADVATFVLNASESSNRGFVYHCRHAHCDGRDRLFFLRQMLERGWLTPGDLTDERFTRAAGDKPDDDADVELTEHDVALAFARHYANALRYCHTAGAWFDWTGSHWSRDKTRLAFTRARQLVAGLNRDSTFKMKASTGKFAFAASVERFAQTDEGLAVSSEVWNPDPWLLGTPGGTVDLQTGRLRPAEPADYISRVTAVAPSDGIACPTWLAFIKQAAGGDQALVDFLQRWFGYCLTGVTREHALLCIVGPGRNGKGVLLGTMAGIMGGYAVTAPMDTFTVSRSNRHPTELAMLDGPRMVTTTETEEGVAWAEARIKALTGGDPITARFMGRDFFTFMPAFKLTVSGNHSPTLSNVDDAARRRVNVVPFRHKPECPNPNLIETLKGEWPGILRWAVEGCLDWQRNGLGQPKIVVDATADYFAEQDVLTQWIEECCEVCDRFGDTNARLYASWQKFAQDRGEEPGKATRFRKMLVDQGFRRDKDCEVFRGRGFRGLRVCAAKAAPHWQDQHG